MVAGPGAGPNNPPRVKVFDLASGSSPLLDIVAYGSTGYGAKGVGFDLEGDGIGELLSGPGPGAVYGPQVRAFDDSGAPVSGVSFYAYGTLKFGVNVAAGQVEGQARDAMLTGAGPGAVFGPHVRGFVRAGGGVAALSRLNFFAFSTLRYGVRVAAGPLDADSRDELAVAPGPGAVFAPLVRGFQYDPAISSMAKINYFAYAQGAFGAKVAVGLLDGDVFAEILTGRGEDVALGADAKGWDYDGSSIAAMSGIDWQPFGSTAGVNVAASDLDEDGRDEFVVGPGPSASATAQVRAYDVDGGAPVLVPGFDFQAFASSNYGLEVGGGDLGR